MLYTEVSISQASNLLCLLHHLFLIDLCTSTNEHHLNHQHTIVRRAAETENEQKKSRRELVERVLLRYVARLKAAAALRAEFDELTRRSVPSAPSGSTNGGGDGDTGDGRGHAAVQPAGAELFRATSVLLFASRLGSTPDREDHARWLHLAKAIVASLHPNTPPER